jgi:hypothetical protein
MRPRGHRAHGTTPLQQFLDKRVVDTKERREGALGTAVFVDSVGLFGYAPECSSGPAALWQGPAACGRIGRAGSS